MASRNRMMTWVSLMHASSFLRDRLEVTLREESGISVLEKDLLGHLARRGAAWRMTDFSEALMISKSGVTQLVDRLQDAGLVRRGAAPYDRRAILICITPKGRKVLGQARRQTERFVKQYFVAVLAPAQLDGLHEALSSLLAAHGRWEGQIQFLKSEES